MMLDQMYMGFLPTQGYIEPWTQKLYGHPSWWLLGSVSFPEVTMEACQDREARVQ